MISNDSAINSEIEELSQTEIAFDLESVSIVGTYSDELSAHRAKKVWIEALESHFLLDDKSDYLIGHQRVETEEEITFVLKCHFISACARYAFWRITNNQAPEAEFTIETAHLPITAESWSAFQVETNDEESPLILDHRNQEVKLNKPWFDTFENILQKLVNTFDNSEKS